MNINSNKPTISVDKTVQTGIRKFKPKIRQSPLSQKLLIRGENKRKFEDLRANILTEIVPLTQIEKILCNKFISAVWKHGRAVEAERNVLNAQNIPHEDDYRDDPFSDFSLNPHFDSLIKRRVRNIKKIDLNKDEVQKILKYQIDLEKNMLKMLERIRHEQELRKSNGKKI